MHRLLVIALAGLAALVVSGSAGAWSWPADGDVLRPFALGGDAYAAGQHRGIDVAGAEGSPVRSPASGTVSFAGTLPTYGRGVTILTADGYAVTLVHLGSIGVAKGDTATEGAPIGSMGSSGDPEHDVPTVHLGIRVETQGEGYVDPLGLLPPRSAAPAPSPPTVAPAPAPAAPPVAAPSSASASAPGASADPARDVAPAARPTDRHRASRPVAAGRRERCRLHLDTVTGVGLGGCGGRAAGSCTDERHDGRRRSRRFADGACDRAVPRRPAGGDVGVRDPDHGRRRRHSTGNRAPADRSDAARPRVRHAGAGEAIAGSEPGRWPRRAPGSDGRPAGRTPNGCFGSNRGRARRRRLAASTRPCDAHRRSARCRCSRACGDAEVDGGSTAGRRDSRRGRAWRRTSRCARRARTARASRDGGRGKGRP